MNITKVTIKNFKNFGEISFELDKVNILIGPNNSGKSSILQALWLWNLGFAEAVEQKKKNTAVSIGISKLYGLNIKKVEEIFANLSLMKSKIIKGKKIPEKIIMEIILDGDYLKKNELTPWSVGCEFYFHGTQEALYCKVKNKEILDSELIDNIKNIRMVYVQPMTNIVVDETPLLLSGINKKIAEGKNGEIIRNLCFKLFNENPKKWSELCDLVRKSFIVELMEPKDVSGNLEINYKKIYSKNEKTLFATSKFFNFSSLGRGCTQYILLLLVIFSNENALILLDEPDAHLEILKQQEIYNTISNLGTKNNSQLIIATHSETVMNRAIDDNIIGVWGNSTHNIIDSESKRHFKNILTKFSLDKYYLADKYGHCLYFEGETDWKILLEFAKLFDQDGKKYLEFVDDANFSRININFVGDDVSKTVVNEFRSIKEVCSKKDGINLKGLGLIDNNANLDKICEHKEPEILIWQKREIENYFFFEETLLNYAEDLEKTGGGDLFLLGFKEKMQEAIIKNLSPIELEKWRVNNLQNIKASEYLDNIFDYLVNNYPQYKNEMLGKGSKNYKKYYYELVKFTPSEKIDTEIKEKIDKIIEVIKS